MALTTGQSRARAALLAEQNRSAEDYTNDGMSGWDAVGRVKYNSDIGLARGIGGKHAGSAGLLNENFYNDLISKGPSGLKIGDFLQTQNNGLDPSSLEYGQAIKNQRVSELKQGSDWWDANPNGEAPSWMDKHGFALTALVMSMGVGAALMGPAAAAGAGAEGAAGAGAAVGAGEAAGLGAAGAGAAGAGSLGAGTAAGLGAGEAAAGLGAMGGAAIPTVTITGAAGGGAAAAGGLGSLGTAGAIGAGAAGLGSLAGGGGAAEPPMQTVNVTGQNPNNLPNTSVSPGTLDSGTLAGAMAGIPAATQGAGSSWSDMNSSAPAGGSGSNGGYNWGNLINQGLGLIGGNVDRIKANQDADWWKGQLDTLSGMYKPGTPEATLMQKEMEAKDAAAGRRSQYGIRATDLAAKLAQQRAGIMTSAGYQNMANAYRNRSSQDLNGLFTAAGNMGGSNGSGWNTIINGIGSYFGGGATPPPSR